MLFAVAERSGWKFAWVRPSSIYRTMGSTDHVSTVCGKRAGLRAVRAFYCGVCRMSEMAISRMTSQKARRRRSMPSESARPASPTSLSTSTRTRGRHTLSSDTNTLTPLSAKENIDRDRIAHHCSVQAWHLACSAHLSDLAPGRRYLGSAAPYQSSTGTGKPVTFRSFATAC